jgi:hypothetical protein
MWAPSLDGLFNRGFAVWCIESLATEGKGVRLNYPHDFHDFDDLMISNLPLVIVDVIFTTQNVSFRGAN